MTAAAFNAAIQILKRLPSSIEMDKQSEALYARALQEAQDQHLAKAMDRVVMECEMRPAPATLVKFMQECRGAAETIPAHYADTRQIIDRCRTDQEGRQKQIEGITPEKCEENRDRARDLVASLAAHSGMDSAKAARKFGEAPDFLRGELAELAEKRARIEAAMPPPVTVSPARTRRRVAR